MLDNAVRIEFDRKKHCVFGENDNLIQVLKSKFDNKFSRRYRTGKDQKQYLTLCFSGILFSLKNLQK
jgi:hypothetical protein